MSPANYERHRFPLQIIAHALQLSFGYSLRLRLVEVMLLERRIVVAYENGLVMSDEILR
jgi:transposase-like protein